MATIRNISVEPLATRRASSIKRSSSTVESRLAATRQRLVVGEGKVGSPVLGRDIPRRHRIKDRVIGHVNYRNSQFKRKHAEMELPPTQGKCSGSCGQSKRELPAQRRQHRRGRRRRGGRGAFKCGGSKDNRTKHLNDPTPDQTKRRFAAIQGAPARRTAGTQTTTAQRPSQEGERLPPKAGRAGSNSNAPPKRAKFKRHDSVFKWTTTHAKTTRATQPAHKPLANSNEAKLRKRDVRQRKH